MPYKKRIGLKLGTVNTLVFRENNDILVHEPSIIAYNIQTNSILGVGEVARDIIGRTPPGVIPIQPLQDGVIADLDMTLNLVTYFLEKVKLSKIYKNEIVICMPAGLNSVERSELMRLISSISRANTYLVHESVATAYGSELEFSMHKGAMVADLGGGKSSCTMVSCGDIVAESSIKVAGKQIDAAIRKYFKYQYRLVIGELTSEILKIKHASVANNFKNYPVTVRGRDLVTGLPKAITFERAELQLAIAATVDKIIDVIKSTFALISPDLVYEVMMDGLILTGGTAQLNGLAQRVEQELCCPVQVANNPISNLVKGVFVASRELDLGGIKHAL
ncbi:rod shape-determining protein MreB [Desulfitispora alkaliphila]|uniref:rod shape-determining protein n=1 Tax=Desulfitispora alkaliphila TaxID=622674 RepID=UPI003D2107FB